VFNLLPDERQKLQKLLPGHVLPATLTACPDRDQLEASIRAAEEGDLDSLKQLEQMFGAASLTSPIPLPPALLAASSSIPSSFLAPTTAHSALSSIPVPSHPPSQLAALNACDQDIEAMEHTEGLREVLEQVKSGLVH